MPDEFEGDLSEAVFWGADLRGARFRDVNMTDVSISHALFVNVDIDAKIEHVTINGVDVTDFVNERDPWYPLRSMIRATAPAEMRATWSALEDTWATTIARAQRLTEAQMHESVGGEFSFVQTLRHLVFAMDKWFTVPILGEEFHPIGLPNRGSMDFGFPNLDLDAAPSFSEALAVRTQRSARLREYLADLTQAELAGTVEVLENGDASINDCMFTVFEEEFEHNRYALRDLAQLEARAS